MLSVVSVALMKQYITYFLIAIWQGLFGMLFISLSVFNDLLVLIICWDLGLEVSHQRLENKFLWALLRFVGLFG